MTLPVEKIRALQISLQSLKSGLVALSGGVDSCVLLVLAAETPGFTVHAATVVSPAHPSWEMDYAARLAGEWNVPHHVRYVDETQNPLVRENGPRRCYYCKLARYLVLKETAQSLGLLHILDGSNADDEYRDRPGHAAIHELDVRTPLMEAGLTKADIREIARMNNLPVWDAPSSACFYTRVPTGEKLLSERIKRIASGETVLRNAGFRAVRLRDHGRLARIELPREHIPEFLSYPDKGSIIKALKELGYLFICIDLEGYREGSQSL